jgi:hypothetical protein
VGARIVGGWKMGSVVSREKAERGQDERERRRRCGCARRKTRASHRRFSTIEKKKNYPPHFSRLPENHGLHVRTSLTPLLTREPPGLYPRAGREGSALLRGVPLSVFRAACTALISTSHPSPPRPHTHAPSSLNSHSLSKSLMTARPTAAAPRARGGAVQAVAAGRCPFSQFSSRGKK